MSTVTKMKAAVNNKNLPILGEDGNLYNYYVGRYTNKLSEFGVYLTTSEQAALNAFIDAGVENGWIDKVKYFLPFIGAESSPISGIVPLIDNVSDYELSVDSVDSSAFTFSNGKIFAFGNRNINSEVSIKIPVKTDDLSNGCNGLSVYFNIRYDAEDLTNFSRGQVINCVDNDNKPFIGVFVGSDGLNPNNKMQSKRRREPSVDANMVAIYPTTSDNIDEVCQFGTYSDVHYNQNNECISRVHVMKMKDEIISGPVRSIMSNAALTEIIYYPGTYDIVLGGPNTPPKALINCLSIMDVTVNSNDMYSFNQAVFALTASLGRH